MLNRKLLGDILTWATQDHLLRAGAEVTVDHAEWGTWNQGSWAYCYDSHIPTSEIKTCTSAFCIAGQAAVQGGDKVLVSADGANAEYVADRDRFPDLSKGQMFAEMDDYDLADLQTIADYALEVLGLAEEGPLFNGDNDIDDVVSYGIGLAWNQEQAVLDLPDYVLDHLDDEVLEGIMNDHDIAALREAYQVVLV